MAKIEEHIDQAHLNTLLDAKKYKNMIVIFTNESGIRDHKGVTCTIRSESDYEKKLRDIIWNTLQLHDTSNMRD